jgi:two-component system sensor kinase ParS
MWRDMDALRNAALRMGHGELSMRVRLSRIAGIRHVGESFNHMAERIAALIENQRSLTNAVSHELRTPLARLSFEVDQLGRGGLPPAHQPVLRDMRADIAELESMVAELLVYARLERPTEEAVRLETVDTRDWLGEALAQVAHQAQARNVRCVVAEGHPPHVCLHPRYMSRALLNLVQNAVRYARGRVEVALTHTSAGHFELIVDDDGPGIPVADRERIFEPFIRLDESRDRGTGGAGLGLAIAQRVAAGHRGAISVTDSPMGGARFVLRWAVPASTAA